MATVSGSTLSGSFTSATQSDDIIISGPSLYQVDGFGTATVALQGNSGDGWVTLKLGDDSTDASFTADRIGVVGFPGVNMAVRFNCTAYTSGTITYRLAKGTG